MRSLAQLIRFSALAALWNAHRGVQREAGELGGQRLEQVFEVDAFVGEHGFEPRAQMVTERRWEVGQRWRWSWLAGTLIAAPK